MRTKDSLPGTIAYVMHRRGISQAELARRAGMSKTQISRYVSGAVTPKFEQLDRVIEGLGVDPLIFFAVAQQVRELGLLTEHRAGGRRRTGGDPVLGVLLDVALGRPEDGERPGADAADPLRTLMRAQRLSLESHRLAVESQRLILEYLETLR
jgi:transcriptional regulator with XRE-family HTH domain